MMNKIISVTEFWIKSPNLWFNATREQDYMIGKYFEDIVNNQDAYIIMTSLDYIIVYDQYARHAYRHEKANHIILYFLQKAISICKILDDVFLDNLDDASWIFAMMPYRHSNQVNDDIIIEAWKRLDTKKNTVLMTRFIKATLNTLPIAFNMKYFSYFSFAKANNDPSLIKRLSVLDNSSTYGIHRDRGTRGLDIIMQYNINVQFDNLLKYIHSNQLTDTNLPKPRLTLMLSGGVDSMVCLDSLLKINADFEAFHINYCNHTYSNDEEMFLRYYCENRNVNLHVRKINEISRKKSMDNAMRFFYEEYTKKCKINGIKTIGNKFVVYGHNKDDVVENVFTNIAKKQFANAYGMSSYAQIYGHTVCRPLLNIMKNEIFKYAHDHGIPYFKNSTPVWSQRGQIRNNVIPCLTNWNDQFINGIYELPKYIDELEIIKKFMLKDVIRDISLFKNEFEMTIKIDQLHIYALKSVWIAIFNTLKTHVSQKSLDHFIVGLSSRKNKYYMLNKFLKLKIANEHTCIKVIFLRIC